MPLILWGPGSVPAGVVVEPTVQMIDVMPTLLDLSGLPVPEDAQGRTLVPLLASSGASGTVNAAGGGRPAVSEKSITKESGTRGRVTEQGRAGAPAQPGLHPVDRG